MRSFSTLCNCCSKNLKVLFFHHPIMIVVVKERLAMSVNNSAILPCELTSVYQTVNPCFACSLPLHATFPMKVPTKVMGVDDS